jgi:hypothetical protein
VRSPTAEQEPAATAEPNGSGPAARWLTVPRLWVVVALGAIGVMQLAVTPNAIDLAYHVKAGELMVRSHELLRSDALAWPTAGKPWHDQNWGAQLLLYAIWRLGELRAAAVRVSRCR